MNADAEFLRRLAIAKQEIADDAPQMLKTIFSTEAERLNHCADVIDRASAIPPREPTQAMLAAPWRKMIENYPAWQPTDVERSNMRYGWISMYDAAIAEKEGK